MSMDVAVITLLQFGDAATITVATFGSREVQTRIWALFRCKVLFTPLPFIR